MRKSAQTALEYLLIIAVALTVVATIGYFITMDAVNIQGGSTSTYGGISNPVQLEECACTDCADCNAKLAKAECDTVFLIQDIIDHSGTCIDFPASGKTLDCLDNKIDGDGGVATGISLHAVSDSTLKSCKISDWSFGVVLNDADSNKITNCEITDNVGTGITINADCDNTILENNILCPNGPVAKDIYNGNPTSSGSNNKCDFVFNWNEDPLTPEPCTDLCTPISPVVCTCDSCDTCTARLADPACPVVTQVADIIVDPARHTCINANLMASKTFTSLPGYKIIGSSTTSTAISAMSLSNSKIANLTISGFGNGILTSGVSPSSHIYNNKINVTALAIQGATNMLIEENLIGGELPDYPAVAIGVHSQSNFTIKNNEVTSGIKAIEIGTSGQFEIDGNTLSTNNPTAESYGIYFVASGGNITNNVISNNKLGVSLGASTVNLTGNTITDNFGAGLDATASSISNMISNHICDNTPDIEFTAATVSNYDDNTCDYISPFGIPLCEYACSAGPGPSPTCYSIAGSTCTVDPNNLLAGETDACNCINTALADTNCQKVILQDDIQTGGDLVCVTMQSGKEFDCQGNTIEYIGTPDYTRHVPTAIAMNSGTSNSKVSECNIKGAFYYGTIMYGSSNTYENNKVEGSYHMALKFEGNDNIITNNELTNSKFGLYYDGDSTESFGNTISNNIICNNWDKDLSVFEQADSPNILSANTVNSNNCDSTNVDTAAWCANPCTCYDVSGTTCTVDPSELASSADACNCMSLAMTNAACTTVELTGDVIDFSGDTCVEMKSNKKLDCLGNTIDGDDTNYRGVSFIAVSNSEVTNCVLTDSGLAVHLRQGSNQNSITNNVMSSNRQGVQLQAARNNLIQKNDISTSTQEGIVISDTSGPADGNRILNNNISENAGGGIQVVSADDTIISNNKIWNNNLNGVEVLGNNNQISDNNISDNRGYGIYTHLSSLPQADRNILCDNDDLDFRLTSTGSNGDDNTCDNPGLWNDLGTTGCTNSCAPFSCDCISCADCTTKLADARCSRVTLITDINEAVATCVSFPQYGASSSKEFRCDSGVSITGPGSGTAISAIGDGSVNIHDCAIDNWDYAISVSSPGHTETSSLTVEDNTISNVDYGISVSDFDTGILIRDNDISSVAQRAISIVDSVVNNILYNTIEGVGPNSYGIYMDNSEIYQIIGAGVAWPYAGIKNCGNAGIYLKDSTFRDRITQYHISNNNIGIHIINSEINERIMSNNIENNAQYGIYAPDASTSVVGIFQNHVCGHGIQDIWAPAITLVNKLPTQLENTCDTENYPGAELCPNSC